jgi:hypothetical protein
VKAKQAIQRPKSAASNVKKASGPRKPQQPAKPRKA